MKILLRKNRGFTLIELLIVIALIGILAVALLSAINPLEQLRKGRDASRKADSAELLNAIERFYASYQCYPWNYASGACAFPGAPLAGTPNPNFASVGGNVNDLLTVNEIKQEYANRVAPTIGTSNAASYLNLFMSENVAAGNTVSICFEPESSTGRSGGLGPTRNVTNTAAATCTGAYVGRSAAATCYVCVPQ